MISIGIAGIGHVAAHQIAAILCLDEFTLSACCDPDPERLSGLSPEVATFTAIDDMLAGIDLDVVVVATPNHLHVEHGIQVLEAGRWLLIEKPAAPSREGFELLGNTLSSLGGRCSVALHAAFGVELMWFIDQLQSGALDLPTACSFESRFYDPYFEDGRLQQRAKSLGGSWMDSGVNALSVICRLVPPAALSLQDSRMTRLPDTGCSEIQGTVDFRFNRPEMPGTGSIDTNWTLGRDSKVTTLRYPDRSVEIVLDHTSQRVIRRDGRGESAIYVCENDLPRLTNHYIGVFSDLAVQIQSNRDNFSYAASLHDLLYDAAI